MTIVKIIKKQQVVYGIIIEMNQVILFSSNYESFKYKTSITGDTYNIHEKITDDDGNEVDNPEYDANKVGKNETEVVIPLKYLSNFWKSLNTPLINWELELILNWSKNCVLADMTVRYAQGNNPAIAAPTESEFKITDTKLYVPVVSLSKENDIKLLEQLKSGLKRTTKWNKYRFQMTIQPKNNNLNYLIDPNLQMFVDYLFCLFQEIIALIAEILFQIIMYQTLKLKILMF